MLEEDASVFKLIGPVLVKQELVEVKNNVAKRVEYIKNDIGRLEGNIKKFEKQQEDVKQEVRAPPAPRVCVASVPPPRCAATPVGFVPALTLHRLVTSQISNLQKGSA